MPDYQKLRGGYYTPQPIANFLAQWAIRTPSDKVLEPSCGDGVLIRAAGERMLALGTSAHTLVDLIVGVELDPQEAVKAASEIERLNGKDSTPAIHIGDFFTYCRNNLLQESLFAPPLAENARFDAIIGNPPFIRYQNFPEEHRAIAFQIMQEAGFKPNRLTNAWLPFLVISTMLLTSKGRLAMVIPAELFQVNYAAETRRFLSDYFSKLTIVTFRELVFPDIQQEVVLLLGEHNGSLDTGIQVVELDNVADLARFDVQSDLADDFKPMDHSTEKWTQYFLERDEILLLRKLRTNPELTLSGEVLDVDVGVVTGQNDFFILTQQQAQEQSLEQFTQRIVARSAHLSGGIFSVEDWQRNLENGLRSYLLSAPAIRFEELPSPLQKYVSKGESHNYHTGYKCRMRDPWYVVPSVWVPDAFMLRQVHAYPKLILNEASATCTDTIHRVRFINGADPRATTAAFVNSLTFAFSEVTGRGYGGGVQTFEPSEAERLFLPLRNSKELDLQAIDKLLRKNDITAVLDITDEILLIQGLGLSTKETRMLRGIWQKLRDRRINRKHKRRSG